LFFILLAQLPVLLTGYLAYRIGRDALEKEISSFLVTVNLQKSSRISAWLTTAVGDLEYLATNPLYQDLSQSLAGGNDQSGRGLKESHLAMRNLYFLPVINKGVFNELFLLRPTDGTVILSSDIDQEGKSKRDQNYFEKGRLDTFVQNIFYSMTYQQPAMVIATPVKNTHGIVTTILCARMNLQNLSVIMRDRSGMRASEDTYLVNAQNFFITEPLYGNKFALRTTVHTDGVKKALLGQKGTARYVDYRGNAVYGAYTYLPDLKIALITEVDEEEYFAAGKNMQKTIIGIGALMAGLSLAAGWAVSSALFSPLHRLVTAVDKMDAEHLAFTEKFSGNNEIAHLAKAFAAMAERLQNSLVSRDTLQQEVNVRREAEKQLQLTMTQLTRSNQELEQFAYVASHDLQEPLRMVSSYVQLLSERYTNQLDDKARKFINYAVDGAVRMQTLIQDLLSLSRVTTKGRAFEMVDCNMLLRQALGYLQVSIADRGAEITSDPLPRVYGDAMQITLVLQNLIGNAIKFCANVPPRIHISAEESVDTWRITVQDNGIGIDAKYGDKIFVIFQRLHTREEYPGTGIGLALCKRIVERHGGEIGFQSSTDKGTAFFFTFPKGNGRRIKGESAHGDEPAHDRNTAR
jgi:signal transduction histidine kinase